MSNPMHYSERLRSEIRRLDGYPGEYDKDRGVTRFLLPRLSLGAEEALIRTFTDILRIEKENGVAWEVAGWCRKLPIDDIANAAEFAAQGRSR
jgi:hypothetical protein